jgi:tRNA 2-thiocytidine biosynthesis protein TtcA
MDRQLFPFETIAPTGVASDDGDKAFDAEDLPEPGDAFGKLPELQVIQLTRN